MRHWIRPLESGTRRIVLAGLALCCLLAAGAPAHATTFTVDDDADEVDATPGDGMCATASATCTLRAAVMEANALPGADAIDFSQEVDFSGSVTLTIAGPSEDFAASGDLDVLEDLEIGGGRQGYLGSTIAAGGLDRIFDVHAGTLTLHSMFLWGGAAPAGEDGGAIRNQAGLSASGLVVKASSAGRDGGGLFNAGNAECSACRFTQNTAPAGDGGGIANTGTLALDVHLYGPGVASNSALRGGGIYNGGTLTALRDSISGNHATSGAGGGLLNDVGGSALLSNLEISDNTATANGEGVENLGAAGLRHVTVAGHDTLGVRNDDLGGATLSTESSVLADACAGTITSTGYNVTASCALAGDGTGNHIGVDPGLIPPGPCIPELDGNPLRCPWFYRPSPASVVIDAGKPGGCVNPLGMPLVVDPRGVLRPTGSGCDIGGIEMIPPCVPPTRNMRNAKLTVSGLDRAPGRQRVKFSGEVAYSAASGIPRPAFFGAQIAIEDLATGTQLVNRSQTLDNPIEAFGSFPWSCHEWNDHNGRSSYREKDSRCQGTPPSGGLVKSLVVTDRVESEGEVGVRFSIKDLTIAPPTGPLRVSYTFGQFAHQSQQGCAALVLEPGDCVLSGGGDTLTCRTWP